VAKVGGHVHPSPPRGNGPAAMPFCTKPMRNFVTFKSSEKLKLFADDFNLFLTGINVNTLNNAYNSCINDLNRTFIANHALARKY